MATLPTIPAFADNDSSLTNLQNLSYAVSFLSNADVQPYWHIYRAATTSLTSSAWTGITMTTKAYDSDNAYDSPGVEIQTQGYYTYSACIDVEAVGATEGCVVAFKLTGGGNNPNLATGVTFSHGYRGASTSTTTADNAYVITDISPFTLYPLDLVQVEVWVSTTMTANFNQNTSYIQGRWVTNFTGRWLRSGP
jgi:hypothetical protein